ncbi:hypothetical protein VNO77_02181 [Canavalia gladiata]|uniref:Uncharacterized protein n=1 Tax=Canavalia gladiata TaxID=3824 RepID=A0AAN9R701_CANGL
MAFLYLAGGLLIWFHCFPLDHDGFSCHKRNHVTFLAVVLYLLVSQEAVDIGVWGEWERTERKVRTKWIRQTILVKVENTSEQLKKAFDSIYAHKKNRSDING